VYRYISTEHRRTAGGASWFLL